MTEIKNISRIYFLGIGGIGMSALARYFLGKNVMVSGYDKTSTALTQKMEKEGMKIHYEDNVDLLDKDADLVVYTPAIPKDQKELNYYKDNGYDLVKRSDLLQEITRSTFNICIAGTHGKTTISTMVAHILRHSGFGCNAFLGGISVNYDTNFWASENNVSVVEADEYDRSFLKLSPDMAVISAMDADHLEIYGTKENMEDAFVEFASQLKPGGVLFTKYGLPDKKFFSFNHYRYSLQNDMADVYGDNITMRDGGYVFDVKSDKWELNDIRLNMGGMHNVENAVVAIAIAFHLNITPIKIKNAIGTFKGVKRRFEYIIPVSEASQLKNNVIYIDDYAHHPEELAALIKGIKSLFSFKKCTVIFQPHLFSRTRDLANEFAKSLDLADRVILLPIYPARELPIEGVSSEMILSKMENKNATVISKEDLLEYLKNDYLKLVEQSSFGEVLVTAGAGDIDRLVEPIKNIIRQS
ncbi:UDP-N-acetylmuramate--L-alanine ligase [Hanamia caeni]|uniref:UDP-N-acetylmuramate--L-alanine ligase n=1 Tax=Hanamia caeni TaxID=2294116 RepID=A0A3M9N2P3_9BACT|nr:UDP-N-acetylmuramate--L-alanine ligase [Hanamia caeni]RNI32082.1 UDP-N-acetylmuramate--L-alanine ligase [Hanamia caeni]